ncbi:MAG: hypothetical protein ABR556_00015 [Pyrinomonadaceae bacterium]
MFFIAIASRSSSRSTGRLSISGSGRRPGDGVAVGICIPGVIWCPGLCAGVGDIVGICIPGIISCDGLGDGDAVGICIPGVMTCGLREGEGLGLLALLVGVRFARVAVLFFLGALLAFGLLAGFIFDMSCPSCCGNTLVVSANIKASALTVRSALLKLLGRFMVSPLPGSPKRTLAMF